jgi:hypothetical protein
MDLQKYPYQNITLQNIKGEKWKDIPGLEGYFVISNFGRIKRLEYETQYRNGAIYIKPEKIIKPYLVKQPNRYKKDQTLFLAGRVKFDGVRHNFMLSRLVYHCFVEHLDLTDHTLVVRFKDNDPFNIRPSNLKKTTLNEKQRDVFVRQRAISPLSQMSAAKRQEIRKKIIKNKSKRITQYTLDGKKVRTYSSMAEAQRKTGIFSSSIGQSALKHTVTTGGYIWRFGEEQPGNITEIRQERRKEFRRKYGRKVSQYDFTGKRIAIFPSIKDAAETTGISTALIAGVAKGVYKAGKGYYWRYGYGKHFINLSRHK